MTPFFVLSMPRSRTAWLSVYLTGAGVFCFHEAWKHVKTAKELRSLMESKGDGPVVNSDSTNIFFLDELREEFPEAKYLRILSDERRVIESTRRAYGAFEEAKLLNAYRSAFTGVTADLTVDYAKWTPKTSLEIWNFVSNGKPIDPHWHEQVNGMQVRLTARQIDHDIERAGNNDFGHIQEAIGV